MRRRRLTSLWNYQVDSFSADELHVGASRIEVSVVGNDVPFLASHAKKNALGGASLMGGNDVFIAKDVLDRIAKAIEAAAACITLIAFHDGRPLMGRHCAGSRIGQKIDQHIVGGKKK